MMGTEVRYCQHKCLLHCVFFKYVYCTKIPIFHSILGNAAFVEPWFTNSSSVHAITTPGKPLGYSVTLLFLRPLAVGIVFAFHILYSDWALCFLFNGCWGLFPGGAVKRQGREADHCTSISLYAFMPEYFIKHRDKFMFILKSPFYVDVCDNRRGAVYGTYGYRCPIRVKDSITLVTCDCQHGHLRYTV
jgi:hypothetical protein